MTGSTPLVERIPIIPLRNYLLVSIQVALSDQMILRLKDDATHAIARGNARAMIIDVSGIDLMDSYIARAIRDIGLICQLMGVETVVSGIEPTIALTLVEMGMELSGVTTALDLDSALDLLDERIAERERHDQLALDDLLKEDDADETSRR